MMLDNTRVVGTYMIVCLYGCCAADYNQELVQAVVAQVVGDIAIWIVVDDVELVLYSWCTTRSVTLAARSTAMTLPA